MSFYRRHVVPFGILGLFLVGLVRPAYLLFSGIFIRSLLLNPTQAFILALFCLCFGVYASVSIRRYLRSPELSFLVSLGAIPYGRLLWLSAQNVFMAGALGFGYVVLMAFHAFSMGMWEGWMMLASVLVSVGVMSNWIANALAVPRGVSVSIRIFPTFRLTYFRLLFEILTRSHQSALLIVKGFSLLFVALTVASGFENVLPQIAMLAFVVSGLLHAALVHQLRKQEMSSMQWVKALPISTFWRIGTHVALYSLLVLPELTLLGLGCWMQGASIMFVVAMLLAVEGTMVLSLGISYLPEMTGQDFMRLMFGVFVVSFLCLIFGIALMWVHVGMLVLGILLTRVWMYRVDDRVDEG